MNDTLAEYAKVRRRDQRDTEAYIAAFDRKQIELLDAVGNIRHKEALNRHLPEINTIIRNFVSPSERKAFEHIPQEIRELTYIRICSQEKPLSGEEKLIHRCYVSLYSIVFSRKISQHLTDALELTGRGICREYRPENNGKYPIRDLDDNAIYIDEIASESFWSESGKRYSSVGVSPFISKETTDEQRALLYDGLSCRKLESIHLQHRGEASLLGTDGVFFEKAYRGECIGVYAGRRGQPNSVRNASYRVTVLDPDTNEHIEDIDGDTILSKMNTSFQYDLFGLPYKQKVSEYSADLALFQITFMGGKKSVLHAFFGYGNPGMEARWNYWYSPQAIRRYFRPRKLPFDGKRSSSDAVKVLAFGYGFKKMDDDAAAQLSFLQKLRT